MSESVLDALNEASLALRDIADSSPNWMEPEADPVGNHSRWCTEFARDAYEKAHVALMRAEAAAAAASSGGPDG